MNDDEEFLFEQEMADVKPLKTESRVTLRRNSGADEGLQERRAAAVAEQGDSNPLTEEGIEALDSWYLLEFKRPGVQNGVYRKLKQGRYESEARLNLHRMGVQRARTELFEFIQQALSLGLRTVLVIHGKGENSGGRERDQASIIKGCVDKWLRELDPVLAFHSAKTRHGGTGAVYVLLRKGDDAKKANRERFRD